MVAWGIKTKWNGTIYYHIGEYNTVEEAYAEAVKGYAWFNGKIGDICVMSR
ncbi:MAG: hypothetical protein WC616_01580 [Candidatus Omnitrophota bacterium]